MHGGIPPRGAPCALFRAWEFAGARQPRAALCLPWAVSFGAFSAGLFIHPFQTKLENLQKTDMHLLFKLTLPRQLRTLLSFAPRFIAGNSKRRTVFENRFNGFSAAPRGECYMDFGIRAVMPHHTLVMPI